MNVHDRLRNELRGRAERVPLDGDGLQAVVAAGDARLRRARIMGAVAATVLVVGVAGVALTLRDTTDPTDEQAVVTTDGDAGADDPEVAPTPEPEAAAADDGGAAESEQAGGDDIATTDGEDDGADDQGDTSEDPDQAAEAEPDDEPDTETSGDDDPGAAETDDPPQVSTAEAPAVIDMLAHNGGFVGRRAGSQLAFSSDGTTWSPIADPRPGERGSIVDMASHNGVLYVVGTAGREANARSWVVASSGLDSWEPVDIGSPPDDGSPLTTIVYTPQSIAVGGAGVVITGQVTVGVDIEALVPADRYEAGDWTLGTNTGDQTKVVIYDPETGAEETVIDLSDEGVPAETLDLLRNPPPFVASGAGRAISVAETDLDARTLLTHAAVGGTEFLAAGFSSEFSSRILWSSADGASWQSVPVSVIGTARADAIGVVDDRVVVFTGDGPLMTVQVRDGGEWTEVRLDELVGSANDDYVLADASFGPGGVAAAIVAIGETGARTLHLVTSADGMAWSSATVASFAGGSPAIVDVSSVGMGTATIAVSYERTGNVHETMSVPVGF